MAAWDRRGHIKRLRPRALSAEAFATAIGEQADPLHVLRPGEVARQPAAHLTGATGTLEQVRADLLLEKWYVDNRLAHWNGPLTQNEPGYINLTPLLSAVAMRANVRLSVTARSSERLHFEVMRRTAPELARLPRARGTRPRRGLSREVAPGRPGEPPRG